MKKINKIKIPVLHFLYGKLSDYARLIKIRLSLLVVFSASMAYLWAGNRQVEPVIIWLLSIGGFFITASANIFNQILERNSDKLMKRTSMRPLAAGRMKLNEALILALVLGIPGLLILQMINLSCAVLGASAMLIYAVIYTPLKKITPLAVAAGAVAGSLPVVIGCIAAKGEITGEAWLLFLIQFIWQFPHTWSIAWLLNEEYKKAGFKMLPSQDGTTQTAAIFIMLSTFLLVPATLMLYMYESVEVNVSGVLALAGVILTLCAYKLYSSRTEKSALGLMLGSLAYLPFVLIFLVAEKFL